MLFAVNVYDHTYEPMHVSVLPLHNVSSPVLACSVVGGPGSAYPQPALLC